MAGLLACAHGQVLYEAFVWSALDSQQQRLLFDVSSLRWRFFLHKTKERARECRVRLLILVIERLDAWRILRSVCGFRSVSFVRSVYLNLVSD